MMRIRVGACACVAWLLLATLAPAGGLTPPGAPSSTMKALDVVEPRIPIGPLTTPGDADSIYRITQPGSYYLTSDVVGIAGFSGIEIDSDDVTIDLMGFTVRGASSSRFGIAMFGSAGARTVGVMNGVIRDWGLRGVEISGVKGAVIRDLRLVGNDLGGMLVTNGAVEGCVAIENGTYGFRSTQATAFLNCTAEGNNGVGFDLDDSASAANCTSILNTSDGFRAATGSVITDCTAQSNTGIGFSVATGSAVVDSVTRDNFQQGIVAADSLVDRCTAFDNRSDGIRVGDDCVVRNSLSNGNGDGGSVGYGIHVTGGDNRIEGNSLIENDIGLRIDAGGNIVMKNSASGNGTNYSFVANNYYGRIVDQTVAATPSVTGNSASNQIGTAEPWSNFAY